MLEVLQQDYIRTARAKGLRRRLVVYRHALRNTLVPLLTTIGIILGGLLSGTFVIETLFNIPGLGRLAIQSIFARDYPVTMAIVLLFTFFYAGLNLVVDLLYGVIDPRIRLAAGRGGARVSPARRRDRRARRLSTRARARTSGGASGGAATRASAASWSPWSCSWRSGGAVARALPVRRHGPPGGLGRALAGAPPGRGRARSRRPEPADRRRPDLAPGRGLGPRADADGRHRWPAWSPATSAAGSTRS